MKLAFMFSGQGSQSVGMLAALAAALPAVNDTFAEASAALGYDLWALCQQGPEERLADTERTQPAMLAAGVAVWRAWQSRAGRQPDMMAGHSLGENSALVAAGAIAFASVMERKTAGDIEMSGVEFQPSEIELVKAIVTRGTQRIASGLPEAARKRLWSAR